MRKIMNVSIGVDSENNSPKEIRDLIIAIMSEAGDRFFVIDSVTIDGVENFKIGHGFINDLAVKNNK